MQGTTRSRVYQPALVRAQDFGGRREQRVNVQPGVGRRWRCRIEAMSVVLEARYLCFAMMCFAMIHGAALCAPVLAWPTGSPLLLQKRPCLEEIDGVKALGEPPVHCSQALPRFR
jgi:hypothetical protein